MSYDIIGDIHGHSDALVALLSAMGYRERNGAWKHPTRSVVFVGDFIDRGPKQIETVNIVRRMVDAGNAQSVMGNHELNAIAWFLPDPNNPGEYLRPHYSKTHGNKNYSQHSAFLNEVINTPMHKEIIDWFLTLPLWLELPEIRVVHACWHQRYIDYLTPFLEDDHKINIDLMVNEISREPDDLSEKDTPEPTIFKAVEALLKGIEIPLPYPHSFQDKDGHIRHRIRTRWWDDGASTFQQAAILDEKSRSALPDVSISDHYRIGCDSDKPIFFGHYWMNGVPRVLSKNVACVDYSIAKGGKLVAYRWDGEQTLRDEGFVYL